MTALVDLPAADEVGLRAVWSLPTEAEVLTLRGWYLGYASSHRAAHNPRHDGQPYAPVRPRGSATGIPCGACRWFESRIFREVLDDDDSRGRYLLHFAGLTVVPGETTLTRHEWARGPYEVVEALTTRRRHSARSPARCPVCTGTGLVSRPPGVAGDQLSWTAAGVGPYSCRTCDGEGVLQRGEVFLTAPAARVLAQAAGFDRDLSDAYVNRAVS